MAFKGLRLKFGVLIIVLTVLWLSSMLYLALFSSHSIGHSEAAGKAAPVASAVASLIAEDMDGSNYTRLETAVNDILANNSEVAYVKLEDASGKVLKEGSRSNVKGLALVVKEVKRDGRALGKVTVGVVPSGQGRVFSDYLVWIPINGILALMSLYVIVVCFNRWVLVPLGRMNKMLEGMAAGGGDLTQRLEADSKDEIGEMAKNLNTFLGTLHEVVKEAQESSNRLLVFSEAIGEKSKKFIESAQEQARATNDNFRALERMDLSVQDVAGSAESLSLTSVDSSATVTEMAAQVEVVAESTMDLSGHAEEASLSISEMANSITEVADNVKMLAELASDTAMAISQIEESIGEVEARAKEAAAISQEVAEDADVLGNKAIARTIDGMERIRESVEDASRVIEDLGESSKEIGQIVKVIDEVTKQTSLLALNAAILAAQAGEHGKGFSVVANEIKELAERTSVSTEEITRLVKSVQQRSKEAVESMRQGRESVLDGARIAYGAADALQQILKSSMHSKDTSVAIETATTQQVEAVRHLSESIINVHERVKSIEHATQEQSKGSGLISSAAEKMSDISMEVRKAMAEQARGIKDFARSLDDTKEMVGNIAEATKSQSENSSELVRSMEKFLEIAQVNSDISAELDEIVTQLLLQAETVKHAMGRFKV